MVAASPGKTLLLGTAMLATLTVAATACAGSGSGNPSPPPTEDSSAPAAGTSSAPAAEDPVVVAAGDIACPVNHRAYNGGEGTATECRQKHTAELILDADHVFVVGNAQYPTGSLSQYRAAYDPTWGRRKSITYPAPGDHDYQSGHARDYLTYFGVEEYYSFDIGSWHWVSLNSEIAHDASSAQVQWLKEDLAATTKPCIGAFWGAPTFSSRLDGNDPEFKPLWDALYAVRADVVLAGEARHYERFAKQTPDGMAASDGIRQFVVGTGGRHLQDFGTIQPNSEVRGKAFGVLQLRLGSSDYSWEFLPESEGAFTDPGTTACNP